MIYESFSWKYELYKCFQVLARYRKLKRITEQSSVNVEKSLMIGAYIIRKLNDAGKIPPDILKNKILIQRYEKMGNIVVDLLNWHKCDKNYNLKKIAYVEKDWLFIINQIIHSFTLIYSFDEKNKFYGFFINSDKTKNKELYFLPLKDILSIFIGISEGNITMAEWKRKKNDFDNNKKASQSEELTLKTASYSYPQGFDLKYIIHQTMNGKIYKRTTVNQVLK